MAESFLLGVDLYGQWFDRINRIDRMNWVVAWRLSDGTKNKRFLQIMNTISLFDNQR